MTSTATASPLRARLFDLATDERLERAVRIVPLAEKVALRAARRYVAGTRVEDALYVAQELARYGIRASIDLFGEQVTDPARADRVAAAYRALAGRLADLPLGTFAAIDLSHLAIAEDPGACAARLQHICAALRPGIELQVGAEEAALADAILDVVISVRREGCPVWATVQANLRRSPEDVDRLAEAGVPVRLVKGAYVEDPAVALPYGPETDQAYVRLAHRLAQRGARRSLATHDPLLHAELRELAGDGFETLLGVRPADARALAESGVGVRTYVPYGPRWFRYAMRRVAEARGAG